MKKKIELLLMIEELRKNLQLIKRNNIKKKLLLSELNKMLEDSIN